MQRYYNGYNYHTFQADIFFSHKNSKKKAKEACTNFVLLSQSRNMIGLFMKIYLHKPIKIQQFFSRGKHNKNV